MLGFASNVSSIPWKVVPTEDGSFYLTDQCKTDVQCKTDHLEKRNTLNKPI